MYRGRMYGINPWFIFFQEWEMLAGDDTNIEARGDDGMSARVWKREET